MIDTREELIDALTEAAELEHNLLIQYLFAAFSLKRRLDEGITPLQQAKIIDWEKTILEVARQEMGHLGLVCNLLSAIGASPRFGRPNFPQPAEKYYPLIGEFTFSKFSKDTLYRFICFELPQGVKPPPKEELFSLKAFALRNAPDPLIYNRVGDLYSQMSSAFGSIPEEVLFIGPNHAQDEDNWSVDLNLQFVYNRVTAQNAIKHIIEEGEGNTQNRDNSHYKKFLQIWDELKISDFEPSRNVANNPMTRMHRDAPNGQINIIENEFTKEVSELFNSVYNTMLLMLIQYYSYGGESKEQRSFIRATLGQMMSGLIRPLAEILTEMPISNNKNSEMAGASFEIYSDLRISPFVENRWKILIERFQNAQADCEKLLNVHPRLTLINQSLTWLANNIIKQI